jgi:hypothetical protein
LLQIHSYQTCQVWYINVYDGWCKNTFHEYSRILLGKQEDGSCLVLKVPGDIVDRLIYDIVETNRNLTIDNWYISYPLVKSLLEKKLCWYFMEQWDRDPCRISRKWESRKLVSGFEKGTALLNWWKRIGP